MSWGRRLRATVPVVLVLVLPGLFLSQVHGAFGGNTTANGTWTTGSVKIADNDGGGTAVLTLSNAALRDTATGCIQVTYTGNLPANVRLYGSTDGSALDPYLDLTIIRGTGLSGAFPTCTGFTPDGATYAAPNGVVYDGTLADFVATHADWTSGLIDPVVGTPESWTNGEAHAYKFIVTVQARTVARGKGTTPTFTWEARGT